MEQINKLCKNIGVNVREFDDFEVKKYKNCLIFELKEENKIGLWYYDGRIYVGNFSEKKPG